MNIENATILCLLVQQGEGLYRTTPAMCMKISVGISDESKPIYLVALPGTTIEHVEADIETARATTGIQPLTADAAVWQTSYLLQRMKKYVAVAGPREIQAPFIRPPNLELDAHMNTKNYREFVNLLVVEKPGC